MEFTRDRRDRTSHRLGSLLAAAAAAGLLGGCTEANLYHRDRSPAQADRVAFRGQACTEDPQVGHFPLRVVFLVDQSDGYNRSLDTVTSRLFATVDAANEHFDPNGDRFDAMRDLIGQYQRDESVSFAVIGFGGSPRVLAPEEGSFTRNVGELEAAIATLAIPQGCEGRSACRDLRGALGTTRSLIEGDLVELSPGARAMTRYVVILMLAGSPSPLPEGAVYCQRAIGGPACCDPERTDCMRDLRARICCPSGEQPCVPFEATALPYCCDHTDDAPCLPDICSEPPASCASGVLVEDVALMRDAIEEAGVGSFNLHAIHLAAEADFNLGDGVDPNEPVARLMQDMAFAGAGRFQSYADGSALDASGTSLQALGLLWSYIELEAKDFIVFNLNALPGLGGAIRPDTDADGLPDDAEAEHGTDPGDPDTDGDGITDYVEVLIEFSPLSPDRPTACEDLIPGLDQDFDLLTDCDEALLGTDMSLVDTDGDAMPDRLEVTMGTDYVISDWLDDSDNDGVPNGDEIRQHTDPRSSDAASHLSTQYRYDISDLGLVARVQVEQPQQLTGVSVDRASEDTSAGLGWLCYNTIDAECDAQMGSICWVDAGDMSQSGGTPSCSACQRGSALAGRPVCIEGSGTYLLSAITDGYEEDSGNGEVTVYSRNLTVEVDTLGLPPRSTNEQLRVVRDERHCLDFVVRNVRLAATAETVDFPETGWNNIALYFAQAPRGRLTVPGIFRLAMIPVQFLPPSQREPPDAELRVFDDEFVRAGTFE